MSGADVFDAWQLLIGISHVANAVRPQRSASKTIPFTLISGFLGSGKTTLLKSILEAPFAQRIAVLVNDFGAINIDAALIRERTASTIELSNGCACCSLAAGLTNTLTDLLASPRPPEAIIMEASGIAEPVGILHVALAHSELFLNGVITVVDAENIEMQASDPRLKSTIERQIKAADIVILNKADLVGPSGIEVARRRIRQISSEARILDCVYANISPQVLLGIELGLAGANTSAETAQEAPHSAFKTWTVTSERPFNDRRLCEFAGSLPVSTLRAKGFVRLARDPPRWHLLQVVGRRWSLAPEDCDIVQEGPSEIVFIGLPTDAEIEAVTTRLRACEASLPPLNYGT